MEFKVTLSNDGRKMPKKKKKLIKITGESEKFFDILIKTLREKFSELKTTEQRLIELSWKDDEDDEITIEDNDDLQNAIESMAGAKINLFVSYGRKDVIGKIS